MNTCVSSTLYSCIFHPGNFDMGGPENFYGANYLFPQRHNSPQQPTNPNPISPLPPPCRHILLAWLKMLYRYRQYQCLGFLWFNEYIRLAQCRCQVPSPGWWHCIFWWRSSTSSLQVGFFPVFGTELLQVASNVLKDPTDYHASCNICVKLLISEGLCTSHWYFSNHEGWNVECLNVYLFLQPQLWRRKIEYEGDGLKWFTRK